MGRYAGYLNPTSGSAGGTRKLINGSGGDLQLGSNEYPISVNWSSCYWYAAGSWGSITIYLCDENGNNQVLLIDESWSGGGHNTAAGARTINVPALRGKKLALYIQAGNSASQGAVLSISGDTALYAFAVNVGSATGGTATASHSTATPGTTVTMTPSPATGYRFVRWTSSPSVTFSGNSFTMPGQAITVTPVFEKITYSITKTVIPAAGGTITAPSTATYGDRVEISAAAAAGYTFTGWSISQGSISDGYFIMPNGNVTLTANFSRNAYAITTEVVPAGAGTISVQGTAGYGDTVAVSQTPAAGYAFKGWTVTGGTTVESGQFTMPNGPVTVKAEYYRLTTGTLDSKTLVGGSTVTLTTEHDSAEYDHDWYLEFGNIGMTGSFEGGGAQTTERIQVPASWANQIPNAQTMTGGVLTITTKKNGVTLGQTQITGLTYQVPADARPIMGAVTSAVAYTVDGVTYANPGAGIFTQGHCGINVAVGQCTAKYGASIASIRVRVHGYQGTAYDRTFTADTANFISGLLTNAGDQEYFSVVVTDSRGLTALLAQTFNVTEYAAPEITSFDTWRVDAQGAADEDGEYGQYSFSMTSTTVGTSIGRAELTVLGDTEDVTAVNKRSGWLLPSSHKSLSRLHAFDVKLRVYDAFEEQSITITLDSGNYMLHFSADGTSVAVGHAVAHTARSGYRGTFEVDEDLDFYYGNLTLKEYIQGVINGTI